MDKELILQKKEKNREANRPPKLTILEEIGNAVSHGIGAILAIIALVLMILKSDTGLKMIASCFYGISLFLLMIMSCLYHSFKADSTVKRVWRRFDYSSIFLLIGGTFAPVFLIYAGGFLGIVLFCIQWAIIIFSITMISVFGPGRMKRFSLIMYLILGWSGIFFIPSWIMNNIPLLLWILGGGIIYTLGIIPFKKSEVKAAHFIWHMVCLLAALVHWVGIYTVLY